MPAAARVGKVYRIYDRAAVYKADGSPVTRGQYVDLKKFLDPTRPTVAEEESGCDAFVIRVAEIYLVQAEANLALGNPAAAATAINVLRTRAALPGKTAPMQVTRRRSRSTSSWTSGRASSRASSSDGSTSNAPVRWWNP